MLISAALSILLVTAPPVSQPYCSTVASAPLPDAKNAITKLESWLTTNVRRNDRLSQEQLSQYEGLVEDLGRLASGRSRTSPEARTYLLDTAAYGLSNPYAPPIASTIRRVAQENILRQIKPGNNGKLLDWLTDEVLLLPDSYTPLQRSVAVRALGQRCLEHEPSSHLLLALLQAARDEESSVRTPALDALVGRPEDFITSFFLSGIERGTVPPELLTAHMGLAAERKDAERPSASLAASRVRRMLDYVAPRMFHEDWREASRCLALMPLFDTEMAVPLLVEGLNQWSLQTEAGTGSRRVVNECREALTRLAGRDLGLNPEIWAKWWRLQNDPSVVLAPVPVEVTSSTFFGLRPVSDKLLFLIDRSGSMRESYNSQNSRFEESIERLLYTLRDLGDKTQFRVVLFSDGARAFSSGLTWATDKDLKELEKWALRVGAGGGTNLAGGVSDSFPGLATGAQAPGEIDVDTVIVLCDGETENPDWVAPWLARYNGAARLKFHCVNIGGEPGGSLEALAQGSGGRFIVAESN